MKKGRRAEAVSAKRVSADGLEHQAIAAVRSVSGFCGREAGRNARGPAVRT